MILTIEVTSRREERSREEEEVKSISLVNGRKEG